MSSEGASAPHTTGTTGGLPAVHLHTTHGSQSAQHQQAVSTESIQGNLLQEQLSKQKRDDRQARQLQGEVNDINMEIARLRGDMWSNCMICLCCFTLVLPGCWGCYSNHNATDKIKSLELKRTAIQNKINLI